MKICIIFLVFIIGVNGWIDNKIRKFNDDFLFGVGTSAYQVEGAWNVDGKGESVLDRYYHNKSQIKDGRNGDIACNSYQNYQRDVQMLRELGVNFYRFSISWARVLPKGFSYEINEKGLEYYHKLIDELLKYNIQPMVTLYHHDLPQVLQDLGGWANPLSVQWFEDYAKVMFEKYASKVKYWITINQPSIVCAGYESIPSISPCVGISGISNYICDRHIILAHAKAYRLYEKDYKPTFKGSVGIALAMEWFDSFDTHEENVEATTRIREFNIDFFTHTIFSKSGDFPPSVKERIAKRSKEQGFLKSRLPEFSASEIEIIKASADFLGINHYTTRLIQASKTNASDISHKADVSVYATSRTEWKKSQSSWLRSVPYGIYRLLIYISEKYNNPSIFITEHGWSTGVGLMDKSRVDDMRNYLSALLLALEDGVNVIGYTAWSLMDNIEWGSGTSERFGLYEVDFDSEEKTRTARLSALVYKRIIKKRIVEKKWQPKSLEIKVSKKRDKDEL